MCHSVNIEKLGPLQSDLVKIRPGMDCMLKKYSSLRLNKTYEVLQALKFIKLL